ncbi:MarR family transcriptional regulator [Brevundimonas sp. 2R-24]|uniref:MarR family transcriptional regulator n=1 Tax=Peiella sedimenti TaxID=3061083 RepID=A0ABT8SLL6_9CAUL|nr:MarR family transcriptional regulator [Caulobacteraceae bacterium XZ-24]
MLHQPRRRRRSTCLQALEAFRRAAPRGGLTELLAFLYVCENEGVNVRELAQLCAIPPLAASRAARALSAPGGGGLIELRRNPSDYRSRTLHLTEPGRALREQVDEAVIDAVRIQHP